MPAMDDPLRNLGDEVQDASEETFDLFSQPQSSSDLGMLDPKSSTLELSIQKRDFTFVQSPGQLQSNRSGGTTGAAVWQTGVRLAKWLSDPKNPLFEHGLLTSNSTVLELGSGISGLVPIVLAPKVNKVIPTDQQYLLKKLRENVEANLAPSRTSSKAETRDRTAKSDTVEVLALDWEETSSPSLLSSQGLGEGVDVITACDCVYNYALIEPFAQTCADICAMRESDGAGGIGGRPTVCLIAQQLRQPEVFEEWLETFMRRFRVWRVRSDVLSDELKEGSGFCVHVAMLE